MLQCRSKSIEMKILSVDPGGHTGFAYYVDGLITTQMLLINKVMLEIDRGAYKDVEIVIIERFSTAGLISRYGLETVDLVGQIKGWCLARERDCRIRPPQSRKAGQDIAHDMLTDFKHVIHEEDALAHLVVFLEQQHKPYRIK